MMHLESLLQLRIPRYFIGSFRVRVQYELAYLVTAVLPSSWSTTVTLPNYTAMYLLLIAINLPVALVFSLLIERPFMKMR